MTRWFRKHFVQKISAANVTDWCILRPNLECFSSNLCYHRRGGCGRRLGIRYRGHVSIFSDVCIFEDFSLFFIIITLIITVVVSNVGKICSLINHFQGILVKWVFFLNRHCGCYYDVFTIWYQRINTFYQNDAFVVLLFHILNFFPKVNDWKRRGTRDCRRKYNFVCPKGTHTLVLNS